MNKYALTFFLSLFMVAGLCQAAEKDSRPGCWEKTKAILNQLPSALKEFVDPPAAAVTSATHAYHGESCNICREP